MHRSGTSALARVVSLLGASLPRHLVPAGLGNELGHWEPEAAVALNDRVLAAAGTTVNGLGGPPDAWFETPAAQDFLAPMREMIEAEFADQTLFVFKDPRSALVFPLWRRALADLGVRCLPVVMLREPVEAAASLVARQHRAVPWQPWTLDRAGLLWLRYTLAAERHTRGGVRAFCSYAGLLDDWRGVALHLADRLGVAWPRPLAEAAPEIEAFLDAGRRHQHAQRVPGGREGIWPFWIAPAFEALRHGEPEAAVLDGIARSFADVCAAIAPAAESARTPAVAAAPAVAVPRAACGQPRVCIVANAAMLDADRIGPLSSVLEGLAGAGAHLTLVPCGDFPGTTRQTLAALAERHAVDIEPCDDNAQPVEPAFLRPAIAVFRHLRARAFDAILFPDHGGPGHACIVAKQAGLAFAETTLAILAGGGSRWQRERERRFPGNLVTLSVEHIEQRAVEGADRVLVPSQEIAQWMHNAGWRWRDSEDLAPACDLRRDVAALLRPDGVQAPRAASASPTAGVTVVITHFERPQLLDQNLQALLRQTDRDFSVLVVDDGSRGADALHYLAGIEERYRGLGLRLLRQPNRYLGAARNAGIRAATTEFVILLDDDNLAFPALVATLRQAAHALQADIVTCGVRHFHDATGTPEAAPDGQGPDQFFAGGPLLVGAVHNCFGDASGIYRRAIFERLGGFHEQRGVTYEDWQLHLRAAASRLRLASLPEPLVWYRVRAGSMLRTTHRHDNARVIASAVRELPCAALEPLADFLIGQEDERVRLNLNAEAIRAASAAQAAALAENGMAARQHAQALEQLVAVRTEDARTAERYAQSLEAALAQARDARDTAAGYARSLEAARVEAETYARHLEAELARWREPERRGPGAGA